jgi:hypothetical protein
MNPFAANDSSSAVARTAVNTQRHFVCRIVYTPTGDKSPVYKTAPDSSG